MYLNLERAVLAFIIVGLISQNGCCSRADDSRAVTYDEVVIGGLFSLHCERRRNRSILCGNFRIDGYEEMTAMLFAVKEINENGDILPGTKLRVEIEDTCSSVELATERSLDYTITKYRYVNDCTTNQSSKVQDSPVLAIVGARDSDVSRSVTNLVGLFHIPVVSYSSTSPSLSGVRYFTRTVPPDTFIAQTMVDILENFHWNYIVLLYSDSEYGRFAADAFRERIRKESGAEKICIAVDEAINAAGSLESKLEAEKGIWMKMEKQQRKTRVVVVFASHADFSRFLQIGKERHDIKNYIWLSDNIWRGQTDNLTSELGYAISIIPDQVYIEEFSDFFYNESFDYVKKEWFDEFQSQRSNLGSTRNTSRSTCLQWRSSQVCYVIDAVYSVAWALHGLIQCNASSEQLYSSADILAAIKKVNFKNPWSKNQVSFTAKGDPKSVAYAVVSLRQTEDGNCFGRVGHWRCLVNENRTCEGNLTIIDEKIFSTNVSTSTFLGVCGMLCPAGQYKVVDKHFASCCWQCKNCTGNKYTDKPGSSACAACVDDQWPNGNHTTCVKVEPKTLTITHPASVIILGINTLCLILLLVLTLVIIKFRQSTMKIFTDRILCYLLLLGIFLCYLSSIVALTDKKKEHCLLLIFISKIGPTCTTATLLIKTNSAYRRYKKKILKEDLRFLSQGVKVLVVCSLVIIEAILTWLSVSFDHGKSKKTSTTIYSVRTETEAIAYLQCVYFYNSFSEDVFTVLEFSFYWGLLLICTHQAYLTRKVTVTFNGLRYVFFCSLAALVNSILTMLASSLTGRQADIKELVFSVHYTFFATVAFASIFVPKMDILIFHPERDALHDALSTSIVSNNMDSVFRLSRRRTSIPDIPGTSTAPQT